MGSITSRIENFWVLQWSTTWNFSGPAKESGSPKAVSRHNHRQTLSARCLSRLSHSLVSMGLALDPVVHLWTRGIYRDICKVYFWDKPF